MDRMELDTPVRLRFKESSGVIDVTLAAHEMLVVASQRVLASKPFAVWTESGTPLLEFKETRKVSGDPFLWAVLQSHVRLLEKVIRDSAFKLKA